MEKKLFFFRAELHPIISSASATCCKVWPGMRKQTRLQYFLNLYYKQNREIMQDIIGKRALQLHFPEFSAVLDFSAAGLHLLPSASYFLCLPRQSSGETDITDNPRGKRAKRGDSWDFFFLSGSFCVRRGEDNTQEGERWA